MGHSNSSENTLTMKLLILAALAAVAAADAALIYGGRGYGGYGGRSYGGYGYGGYRGKREATAAMVPTGARGRLSLRLMPPFSTDVAAMVATDTEVTAAMVATVDRC